jgi:hypothetical protein
MDIAAMQKEKTRRHKSPRENAENEKRRAEARLECFLCAYY